MHRIALLNRHPCPFHHGQATNRPHTVTWQLLLTSQVPSSFTSTCVEIGKGISRKYYIFLLAETFLALKGRVFTISTSSSPLVCQLSFWDSWTSWAATSTVKKNPQVTVHSPFYISEPTPLDTSLGPHSPHSPLIVTPSSGSYMTVSVLTFLGQSL